ncbi:hypothetical protein ASE14_07095 [Agromyces sp. Root81]|uniref:hypothetical protein n=1 Tax=Agromyces sp. Root81 TaxID=1736601 RepID=UPI0006FA4D95|nr:hypothetical protein [Agromyces sp. Root81]KRC60737.1 hypothetical protein ASE14_07095 [Agromyces sp. Root81]
MTIRVCFLTGRSDRSNTALSPVQRAFLDGLPITTEERVEVNFPYRPASGPWRRTPLPIASVRNARDYFGSRRAAFAHEHRAAVSEALAASDRTLVLAGSCGLELLANLRLDDDVLARLHVVAYGPVARSRPVAARLETVTGRADALARRSTGTPDHEIDAHHLDYLSSPELRDIVVAAIERLRAEQGVPA